MWSLCGNNDSVFTNNWPNFDDSKLKLDTVNIVFQVNGKLIVQINAYNNDSKEDILNDSKRHNNVSVYLDGKKILKEIYVPGKLVNFVVK